MTDKPLCVAFLWHMHQPPYKDPETSVYRLPWVRLHGTKDYLDMVQILSDFPDIKQTFNITPSLLEQIVDYTEHNALDRHMELTRRPASALDTDEKLFILRNFFLANWDNMIKPIPRYHELLNKRGLHFTASDLVSISRYFSDDDIRDLQVLFNLCWIDLSFRESEPFLKMLSDKGSAYTEEEKNILLASQLSILDEIIPVYREASARGQIELSVSPYYHPILPLLCDTNSAKTAMPDITLPRIRFLHPEDASNQIRMSLEYFEKLFGHRPYGMWPSEGSVSEDVLKILGQEGVRWIGSDEDILSNSLDKQLRDTSGNIIEPAILYEPYLFENVSIVFRDHILSDLIGFVYSQWEPKNAAEDFISRLLNIKTILPNDKAHLVSVILDGENAWEYYRNDGRDFLKYLYEGLSREERLKTVTISEYLREYDNKRSLKKLHAGSWISANFRTWVGHEEKNTAWEYLSETRDKLVSFQNLNPYKDLSEAWRFIYIAEGSDWTWWYGDEHKTDSLNDFDELFRMNLVKVHKEIGGPVPERLYVPIHSKDRGIQPKVTVRGFIEPKLDGTVTSYYEWYQAAYMDIKKTGGSMYKAESIFSGLYYGFNQDTLFLRMDPLFPFQELSGITFSINFIKPSQIKINVSLDPSLKAEMFLKRDDAWEKIKDIEGVAVQDIFEIGISFQDIMAHEKDEMALFIDILKNNESLERYPWRGYITFSVPTADFESTLWY